VSNRRGKEHSPHMYLSRFPLLQSNYQGISMQGLVPLLHGGVVSSPYQVHCYRSSYRRIVVIPYLVAEAAASSFGPRFELSVQFRSLCYPNQAERGHCTILLEEAYRPPLHCQIRDLSLLGRCTVCHCACGACRQRAVLHLVHSLRSCVI
jgi:hypothetical protein